jgi:RNA polymerase sigma-70 factor, ECF subfamily
MESRRLLIADAIAVFCALEIGGHERHERSEKAVSEWDTLGLPGTLILDVEFKDDIARPEAPPMAETSSTLLARLSDRSDSIAWRRMVDLYSPLISAWLRRHGVSPADAEDLTQETLAVVVREVSRFQHNGRVGAFRAWLRTITINCLRQSLRSRRLRFHATGSPDVTAMLDQLEDPDSDLSRRWDHEHDEHVLKRLLELIEPEFRLATWQAFRRQVIDGASAATVAAELDLSVNAVLIAKSRALGHLRRDAQGLID